MEYGTITELKLVQHVDAGFDIYILCWNCDKKNKYTNEYCKHCGVAL